MTRYTVTVVEVVETTFELEVEATDEHQARLAAEDIIVNHDEAAETAISAEKQISIEFTTTE